MVKDLPSDTHSVTGVAILNEKVYVTGTFRQGHIIKGCFWIDGVRQVLPGNPRLASGIAP